MLAVIRLKGGMKANKEILDTFKIMKIPNINSAIIIEDSETSRGMMKKVENYIAWGEASTNTEEIIKKKKNLHPPLKGFRSFKARYPKGNIGYYGDKINNLVKRMSE